jgi:hypothetical protein
MTRSPRLRWLAIGGLVVWIAGGLAVGGLLLIKHLVALPTPAITDHTLRDAVAASTPSGRWRAVHFMYRSCPCSRRTIDHLLHEPPLPDLHQLVVMVDDEGGPGPEDDRLRAAGFEVVIVTPDVLRARYHVEAAPMLVFVSPDGELAYVGGYNRHKQSPAYEDREILSNLRAHHESRPLPVFGCATSSRLARIVDPLNLDRLR